MSVADEIFSDAAHIQPPRPWPRSPMECYTRAPQSPAPFELLYLEMPGYVMIRPKPQEMKT